MRPISLLLLVVALTLGADLAHAKLPAEPVVQLTTGLWVEVLDLDPTVSSREVRHVWLHRGTLLFGTRRPEGGGPFREAVTYFGLPVRFLAQRRESGWNIREIDERTRSAFHLTRNVFCPGESSALLREGECLRGGTLIGEGYVFEFSRLDADGDGVPDLKNRQEFVRASVHLDQATTAEIGAERQYTIDIYDEDLDRYESEGALFRLDRDYPRREVRFLDSDYQRCGSTETSVIRKDTAVKSYAEAEGKAGFDFWGWLSASLKVGITGTETDVASDSITLASTTEEGTTFRQWGLIFDYSFPPEDAAHQTPFFVEKELECVNNVGQVGFGDRISRIEIGVLDYFSGKNDEYEFNRSTDFQRVDDRVLDKLDKPVFISINDSDGQAAALEVIKEIYGINENYLAMFVFSQLNLACPEKDRPECLGYFTKNPD